MKMGENLVRDSTPQDNLAVIAIAKSLPDHFTTEAITEIINDLDSKKISTLVATHNGKIVGFLTYQSAGTTHVEIKWMGVAPHAQNQRVGSLLMQECIARLQTKGIKVIELATLASTVNFKPFEKTRKFFEKFGFTEVRIDQNHYNVGDHRAIFRKEL